MKGPRPTCDVCGKTARMLSGFPNDGDTHDRTKEGRSWLVCARCFNRADIMACNKDRQHWPGGVEFAELRAKYAVKRALKISKETPPQLP